MITVNWRIIVLSDRNVEYLTLLICRKCFKGFRFGWHFINRRIKPTNYVSMPCVLRCLTLWRHQNIIAAVRLFSSEMAYAFLLPHLLQRWLKIFQGQPWMIRQWKTTVMKNAQIYIIFFYLVNIMRFQSSANHSHCLNIAFQSIFLKKCVDVATWQSRYFFYWPENTDCFSLKSIKKRTLNPLRDQGCYPP